MVVASRARVLEQLDPQHVIVPRHAGARDTSASVRASSITRVFERQARKTPDATAVVDDRECVTFRQLNTRANQLAHRLRAGGVTRETIVGVALDRSIDMVVALLGVLKAGGAYVPLDPAYPIASLTFMIEDSKPKVIITRTRLVAGLPAVAPVLCLDADRDVGAHDHENDAPCLTTPDDAAYVIYTSGTTGRPKGVVGLHRGALNRFAWMWQAYPFVDGEVCCQRTSLSFVDSVAEIFGPLLRGVPIYIASADAARDPRALVDSIAAHAVTRLVLVPSLLRDILALGDVLEHRLAGLRICVSSGEPLPAELARRFRARLPGTTLLNLYGSTEVAADVTYYDTALLPADAASVPLGRPIANTQLYILDAALAPVPPNVPGDLYVGGDSLARGYLHRVEETAERFIPDPFASRANARMYRTGDRARSGEDGTIEFLGRIDHQVKIRGVRVELGEIETVLAAHPSLAQCVVVAQRYGLDTGLVAYVVTRSAGGFDVESLRTYCRLKLPEHMVPSAFVHLDTLPLTASGKVDRHALAAPVTARAAHVGATLVAPRTVIEHQLVSMWAELLGFEDVGITDDFFDLGGNSLLAVRLAVQIEDAFGRRLPVSTIAQMRTIERLAALLSRRELPGPWTPLVDLQPAGPNPPFFLVHGIGGEVVSFRNLAQCMAPAQPFYGLRAKGSEGVEKALPDVESMAACYIDAIKTVSPRGPYLLGGYSSGGTVAFEMAQQLRARGDHVAPLVLIDADAPESLGPPQLNPRSAFEYVRNLMTWPIDDDFFRSGLGAAVGRLRSKARMLGARLTRLVARRSVAVDIRDSLGVWRLPESHRTFLEEHARALAAYQPRPYEGPIVLLRARTASLSGWRAPDLGWRAVARGGLTIKTVRGAHDNILTQPRVRSLAAQLAAFLNSPQMSRASAVVSGVTGR